MTKAATFESLIVATASPRRRDLVATLALGQRGVDVSFQAASIDETVVGKGLDPAARVAAIALAKARAVETKIHGPLAGVAVLGADTMVVSADVALGKPDNDSHLRAMLREFGGASIAVLTSMTLLQPDGSIGTAVTTTHVTMHEIRSAEIEDYVASGAGRDKAGGLELQGAAAPFIAAVEGCWTNVVGLPLCQLKRLLGAASDMCSRTHTADCCHRHAVSPGSAASPAR